jgi:protein-S-isoprenylcysteine O-methyltransferase Ste14
MPTSEPSVPVSGLNAYGRRRILQVIITLAIAVAIYLAAAGRLDAIWIWVYAGIGLLGILFGGLYVMRRNPEAINERGRPPEKQPGWDRLIILVYSIMYVGVYILGGLDARFGWSNMAPWLHILGGLGVVGGGALTYMAMAYNKFLSMYVQVVEERGHQVATGGPYRYVRHPMYASLVLSWPALGLLLGSWGALLAGGLAAAMIVIRTALEDRKLRAELAGYDRYANQVRYRLIPGVW